MPPNEYSMGAGGKNARLINNRGKCSRDARVRGFPSRLSGLIPGGGGFRLGERSPGNSFRSSPSGVSVVAGGPLSGSDGAQRPAR